MNKLEKFNTMTLEMSQASTPTLSWTLPFYTSLEEHLTDMLKTPVSKQVKAGIQAGFGLLQKYHRYVKNNQYAIIATRMLAPSS